jgi:hypothetical protein
MLPLGGVGNVENQIDESSGLSTVYGGDNTNDLNIANLMSTVPGHSEKIHLHPFRSLRVLFDTLGDSESFELSSMTESFTVTAKNFIEVEYPLDLSEPTKSVLNGTKTEEYEEKEATAWSITIYAILMLVSLVAIIVFTKMLCSSGNEEKKANNILGEEAGAPLTGGQQVN